MQIQIRHIPNTFNYGSFMMAISLINKLKENIENVKIYVDAKGDDNLERLKIETNFKNIYFNDNYDELNKKENKSGLGITIFLGGDDLSECYPLRSLNTIFKRINKSSENGRVFLIGQTIGPFTGERIELAKNTLNKTKIYTRDDNTFNYLKSIGVRNVEKGVDLALTKLPNEHKKESILSVYNLNKNNYITMVLSGLSEKYTTNKNDYLQEIKKIIIDLLDNELLSDKKVALFPHVVRRRDDREMIKEVMDIIDDKYKERIIPIYDEILASEARQLLGNGFFTITGRMHAAISTLYMRKPAIAISYSVKYKGVISEGLNLRDLVIESNDDDLWSKSLISESINEKVAYIIENYDDLVNEIDEEVSKAEHKLELEFNQIIKDLNVFKAKR